MARIINKDNYLVEGPVTAGMINRLLKELGSNSETGGHSVFLGQVRADETATSRVAAIEYSAYEPMVKAEAGKIIMEIRESFSDVRQISLIHSTGLVNAGEISLFVLVSAVHRRHAIDACNKMVELLKARLPVWKKEIFEDSSQNWKSNDPV